MISGCLGDVQRILDMHDLSKTEFLKKSKNDLLNFKEKQSLAHQGKRAGILLSSFWGTRLLCKKTIQLPGLKMNPRQFLPRKTGPPCSREWAFEIFSTTCRAFSWLFTVFPKPPEIKITPFARSLSTILSTPYI